MKSEEIFKKDSISLDTRLIFVSTSLKGNLRLIDGNKRAIVSTRIGKLNWKQSLLGNFISYSRLYMGKSGKMTSSSGPPPQNTIPTTNIQARRGGIG